MPAHTSRVPVSGVELDAVTPAQARDFIRTAILLGSRPARHVVTVNLDFLALAERDPDFRCILNRADLATADGEAVRWLALLAGYRIPVRVAGADLTAWLLGGAVREARVFLLGTTPTVLSAARAWAAGNGTVVTGCTSPSRPTLASAARSAALVDQVNATGSNILLVALGAPLQEWWIARHRSTLDVAVAMGVGCGLDVVAGAARRAPPVMQRLGMEWLFRLSHDPRRLWGRYVRRDIPFFGRELPRSMRARLALPGLLAGPDARLARGPER